MSRQSKPGESALRHFRELRSANIRRDWRLWSGFAVVAAIAIVLIATLRPIGLAIGGALLGFIAAFLMVGWMIAFDVRALPWLWGVWGEEETGEELSKLDSSWHVTHDIANDHG